MYTIVKLAFWFGLVLFFMPLSDDSGETAPRVSAVQALYAAKEAVEDVRGICDRQPRVCETGSAAFQKIGVSAREGARLAYTYLDARYGAQQPDIKTPAPREDVAPDPVAGG